MRARAQRALSIYNLDLMVQGDTVAAVRELVAEGEFLIAFDLSAQLLEEEVLGDPVDRITLAYLRALSLARAGSTGRAAGEVSQLRRQSGELRLPAGLTEDIAALDARIAKDRAFALGGTERRRAARDAAARYEAVYRQLGRPFACINAATLWELGGERARSSELAAAALATPVAADDEEGAYWAEATAAEASILLGDLDAARVYLTNASVLNVGDLGARASTLRQLNELCSHLTIDRDLLEPLRNPLVLHYCGHRIADRSGGGGFPAERTATVGRRIDEALDGARYGAAYGSLACGADILAAESVIERGIDLHVVLPFDHDEFVDVSVAAAGASWVDRFWRCYRASKSVTVASDSGFQGDDVLFGYASSIAMGSALNRARSWATHATQLAVWDGVETAGCAGTAHDVRRWREAGGSTVVIDVAEITHDAAVRPPSLGRTILPILFGDVNGFSRLHDDRMGTFLDNVMAPVGEYLRAMGDVVLHRATWGDGIKVILSDVEAAARAALAIQELLESVSMVGAGLPSDMGMRMSGHVGPVVEVVDPIVGDRSFTGRELTRAARIEPRTPVGQVYVSHAFASLLALEPTTPALPEYVGKITTAKDFETVPMYVLAPRRETQS